MKKQESSRKGFSHKPQLHRISRIEGQVRGVIGMVESERYCIDILTQLKAIKSAISSVERNIIESHIAHCVQDAVSMRDVAQANEKLNEIKSLLKNI